MAIIAAEKTLFFTGSTPFKRCTARSSKEPLPFVALRAGKLGGACADAVKGV